MGEPVKTSNKRVWIGLGLVILVAVGVLAAWQAGLFKSSPGQWSFTSMRPGEELPAKNESTLYAGDRLLAWSPYSSRRFGYVFIQDQLKLETDAGEVIPGEVDGKQVWAGGVELGRGYGPVRLVVIDAGREIAEVSRHLKAANDERAEPDRRLALLELRLRRELKDDTLTLFRSPWYTLAGNRPGGEAAGAAAGSGGQAPAGEPVPAEAATGGNPGAAQPANPDGQPDPAPETDESP